MKIVIRIFGLIGCFFLIFILNFFLLTAISKDTDDSFIRSAVRASMNFALLLMPAVCMVIFRNQASIRSKSLILSKLVPCIFLFKFLILIVSQTLTNSAFLILTIGFLTQLGVFLLSIFLARFFLKKDKEIRT